MSDVTERIRMIGSLAGYRLMGLPDVAELLGCSATVVTEMIERRELPAAKVGARWRFDPLDVVVYLMASQDGITAREYWTRHGESVPEHARRFVERRRIFRGDAA